MNTHTDCSVQERQSNDSILWSNFIVNTPLVYSLLEKRVLYFLTLQIKKRFIEKQLRSATTWADLTFQLTSQDLGVVGGETHINQTYQALSDIGEKFMSVQFRNNKGQWIIGKVHWVDSFFYNTETELYEVRISPEVMPYLIDLSKNFTSFQVSTALELKSKFTQKFYELCCEYSGDFRYKVSKGQPPFKKNVLPISIESFRLLFGLDEEKDSKTGKIISPKKYPNFSNLNKYVIEPAQKELYELYFSNKSNVWFDCIPYQRKGRKVISLLLFVYTKEHPKKGLSRPWQAGDEPLNPFESFNTQTPQKNLSIASYKELPIEQIFQIIKTLLSKYLSEKDVSYYLHYLMQPQFKTRDSYIQVIQVVLDKIQQEKFTSSTKAYQRKSIKEFVLQENLKAYGWSIPSPPRNKRSSSNPLDSMRNKVLQGLAHR